MTEVAEQQASVGAEDSGAVAPPSSDEAPAPSSPTEQAEKIIEEAKVAARVELERRASIHDVATRQGVEVWRGEVFPWKGALWRVAGTTQVIEHDDAEPVGAVAVVPVKVIGRGWRRSEKLSRKARKRALERLATARLAGRA